MEAINQAINLILGTLPPVCRRTYEVWSSDRITGEDLWTIEILEDGSRWDAPAEWKGAIANALEVIQNLHILGEEIQTAEFLK